MKLSRAGALAATVVGAILATAAAHAQEEKPLSADELAECAALVQTLREESPPLNQQAAQFDKRRAALRQRYAQVREELESGAADAGEGTRSQDRWARYNSDAAAFNEDIAEFRREVNELNKVKDEYDRNCAGRAYRRSDLEELPEDAREAMRAGTADIRVPYTDGEELPTTDSSP